jgi:hypothetical protein
MDTVSIVTKRQAAVRQLNQAIRLFFQGGDMLAIHTITAAAFQLFEDLGKPSGISSVVRSEATINPARLKEWVAALNSTQNFLKHADRDQDATLRYVEAGTVFFLFEAVELARRVGEKVERERLAFTMWFISTFPTVIDPAALAALRAANAYGLDQTDKALWAAWLGKA